MNGGRHLQIPSSWLQESNNGNQGDGLGREASFHDGAALSDVFVIV